MPDATPEATLSEMGPVDYLVIEFAESRMTGEAVPLMVDLVERGVIRILDLVVLSRSEDGTLGPVELGPVELGAVELGAVDGDGVLSLSVFAGATSGLLDEGDLHDAATVIAPGMSACIVVYENLWAAPLAVALRRGGAQMVANGRIPVQALLAAAEAADHTTP